MINIFEKYNKLTDKQKKDLEDLYVIHQLLQQIENHKELNLTMLEEKILYKKAKECLTSSNINCKEIITRLLEMLKCVDITICDIDDLEVAELIELLSKEDSDFKDIEPEKDVIFAFTTNKFYCLLLRVGEQYMLVCEKDNGTQYQRKFKSKNDLGFYLSRKFLQEHGELFV